ncbi:MULTISPECIES: HAD family hydrolase [unclassified Streptomyces]|uniref:HAD family hydrolase n=1 Tax=unclassified Streptomyces TaxID=2593676 RepID=UPI0036E8F742
MTAELEELRELITGARVVLWDFDGPICRLFARHSAQGVAIRLIDWLEARGLRGLVTEDERDTLNPQIILGAVNRRRPDSDLVEALEERLTSEELQAAASAMPTPHADTLIRTWTAVGARLAVTTNNSPRAASSYLTGRGLDSCFAPHIYGRTQRLEHLKPHPHCLNRALTAMGVDPARALMIGDADYDFIAARSAGVPFLGYARNERKEKLLRGAGVKVTVSSLDQIRNVLLDRA